VIFNPSLRLLSLLVGGIAIHTAQASLELKQKLAAAIYVPLRGVLRL
jgi:hypothetical protein